MDHDGTTTNRRCWLSIVSTADVVVADDSTTVHVPNLDAEQINIRRRGQICIDGGQHKAIVTAAIDRTNSFVMRVGWDCQ